MLGYDDVEIGHNYLGLKIGSDRTTSDFHDFKD